MWDHTPQALAVFKTHMIQFLSLAAGGPAKYEGKNMRTTHMGMKTSNPEFDAAIGDLQASLDLLKGPDGKQKALLAIIESTRPHL